jgi:hypothetical protein
MSVKFQVTLPEAVLAELKQQSAKMGVPVAEFIRQTIDDRLRKRERVPRTDPFDCIDGLVDSGESDLASRVDEILYA